MSKITGRDGVFKLNDQDLGEVRNWSIDVTGEAAEASVIGTTWREFLGTVRGFGGTFELYYNKEDLGQGEIVAGEVITFEVYPEGEGIGNELISGSAVITGSTKSASFDGMTESTVTIQGTGELVVGDVVLP